MVNLCMLLVSIVLWESSTNTFQLPCGTHSGCYNIDWTPCYYAQVNGQVEAANKIIIGLIKKYVAKKPKELAQDIRSSFMGVSNIP